ncbi:Alpha-N-acetylgalactosaminidase [Lentibacillus sp. JNUCC-1]|uniref:thiol-disulfide oxidoreductase DCC family protein n=1 Tax=Lentibacillus sp. JNUCC-1 TaxID=2654513 RepID=UPI0012E910BE|nr:thiol-disulfide oxidoreductase DCC family protein [Lentibacillus sp. JNUCC-1]MUV38332.1 Alpha-N-acetylgalactosaminidase [Lentibacillus sp. JNUCC-1]
MSGIVLFDGVCHFCDASVQFIIKRDPHRHFKFASLQSEVGERLLLEYGVPQDTDSFVLIDQGRAFIQSTAALKMCRYLRFPWKIFYAFLLVPRPIRDFFYNVVAKNRYRWFGKKEACTLPTVEDKERFL